MKINDLKLENEKSDSVKSDSSKVADLVRSGQDINLAVDTYRNIHSGQLDYDAAFSKASQSRSGTNEPRSVGDVAALNKKEIDALVSKQVQDKLNKNATAKKGLGGEIQKVKVEPSRGEELPDQFVRDPKTGSLVPSKRAFRGNQYTGGIPGPSKAIQKAKDIIDDPLSFVTNPLGATDTDDAITKGSDLGRRLFTPRTGIVKRNKLSIRSPQ